MKSSIKIGIVAFSLGVTVGIIVTRQLEKKDQSEEPEILQQGNQLQVNASELYQRALNYSRNGKVADAVTELKLLVSKGDTAAVRLYNQINPIKKRQTGTQIRCMDGTISHSKRKTATCANHGGVKDWNEPVYEEYREYE